MRVQLRAFWGGQLDESRESPYNGGMITCRGVGPSHELTQREGFRATLPQRFPGAVVLATCDRVEVYEGAGLPAPAVVKHLFRVTAGLESPFLGEHQIQGQVKQAYLEACRQGNLDPGLHRLFQSALRTGKRIRTETSIGRGALGHAQAAARLLEALPVPLSQLSLLVIGVNHLNRGILRFLVRQGHHSFFLGNRTLEAAQHLVRDLGAGEALPLNHLSQVLPQVDVVLSATSAPHLIVRSEHLPDQGGPRWFFDLAVPRDIDPEIGTRPGVTLYNVADLEREMARTQSVRQGELTMAETIVSEETDRYFQKAGYSSALNRS